MDQLRSGTAIVDRHVHRIEYQLRWLEVIGHRPDYGLSIVGVEYERDVTLAFPGSRVGDAYHREAV